MDNIKERAIIIKQDLIEGFKAAGLKPGQHVFVHCGLKGLGYVCGGPQVVIEALMALITEAGTIIMPTQSWKNLDPAAGVHWEEPQEWWDIIRQNWPAYDKDITPTNTMGAVAEMFRRWPGVLRSDHPARSVAAWGRYADHVTKDHDLSNIFGEGSPVAKLYELDGYVLLIGVGYDKNTSIHLADVRASYPNKRYANESSAVLVAGCRQWVTYETLVVEGEDFEAIGAEFEKNSRVGLATIGNGTLRLMKQREIVDFAVGWIEENRK